MPADRRRPLHRAAAESIARRPGSKGDRDAALATHWEHAGEPDRARPLYLSAARHARSRYAYPEAERLYQSYLRLVESPTSESVSARNELGRKVLILLGKLDAALESHRQAASEALTLGDLDAEAETFLCIGEIHARTAASEKALDAWERGVQRARSAGNQTVEAAILRMRGNHYLDLGRHNDAHTTLMGMLPLAEKLGGRQLAYTLGTLSIVSQHQGRFEDAESQAQRAMTLHRAMGDQVGEAAALGAIANVLAKQGRSDDAREYYEKALALERETGNRRMEGVVLGNLGRLHRREGRMEETLRACRRALEIAVEVGDRYSEDLALDALAQTEFDLGNVAQAQELFERAIVTARETKALHLEGYVLTGLASTLHARREFERAEELLERAVHIMEEIGDPWGIAGARGCLGAIRRDQGRWEEARALIDPGRNWHREREDPRSEGIELNDLARLERWAGNLAEARSLTDRGILLLRGTAVPLQLGQCLAERGHCALCERQDASPYLEEASEIARRLRVGPHGELGMALRRLSRAIEAQTRGARLWRGDVEEELPPSVRDRIAREDGEGTV